LVHPTRIAQRPSQPHTRDTLRTTSGMNLTTPPNTLTPMHWIPLERTSLGTDLKNLVLCETKQIHAALTACAAYSVGQTSRVTLVPTRPVTEGVEARQQNRHRKNTSIPPRMNQLGKCLIYVPRVEGERSAFAQPPDHEGCRANHPHAHRELAGYTLAGAADAGLPSTPDSTLSLRRHRGRGHRIRLLRRRVRSRAECHAETTCR
jgi:hypothetical protein